MCIRDRSDSRCDRPRCHIVGAAESGKEVIERLFVRDVDHGKSRTPFVFVAIRQIIHAHCHVEEIARRDARRVMIVILGSGGRYLDVLGTVFGRRAEALSLIHISVAI